MKRGGYVRKIPRDPSDIEPIADFRDKFLASESEQQTPSGDSTQEEKGTCDDGSATKRYEVYDGNETWGNNYHRIYRPRDLRDWLYRHKDKGTEG